MKVLAVVIGVVLAVAAAAFAAALAFPDRLGDYLPGFMQPSVQGGPQLVLQVEPDGDDIGQAVTDSIKVIERRLKDLGTRAVVEKRETDRILVQLSRSADVRRSIEILTRRGKLEFRLVDNSMTVEQAMSGQPPAGSEVLHDPERPFPVLVEKRVLLTGRDLVDAQAAFDSRTNTPVISFRFSADGARRFGQVTQENVGRALAIVFDNKVLSAPVIREPILGGSGQISGNLTVEDANNMAILLRAGELPGRLVVIEQRAAAP